MSIIRTLSLHGFLLAAATTALAQTPPPAAPVAASETTAVPVDSSLPALPTAPTNVEAVPAVVEGAPISLIPGVSIMTDAQFSYGNVPYSLMFTPDQVSNMKNALATYETIRRTRGSGDIVVEEAAAPNAPVITEPAFYPVFTLSSIAYKNKKDWTVWIGGVRITPRTNTQDVHVDAVTPDSAQFSWEPEYISFLIRRQQEKRFAPIDPVKHKLTKPNTALLDTQGKRVMFRLKPNQSFVAGYMATFEGRLDPPKLEPLPAADSLIVTEGMAPVQAPAGTNPNGTTTITSGVGSDAVARMYKQAGGERAVSTSPETTMDKLLENQQTPPSTTP